MKSSPKVTNLSLSITLKLVFVYSFIIISGLVILAARFTFTQTEMLEKQAAQLNIALVSQATASFKMPLLIKSYGDVKTITAKLHQIESIIGVNVYDNAHNLMSSKGFRLQQISFPIEGQNYSQHIEILENTFININKTATYTVAIKDNAQLLGYLSVSFEQNLLAESKKEILWGLMWVMLVSLGFCAIAAFYIGKRVAKPLNDLMDVSSAISRGTSAFDTSSERRHDELDILMDSLNEMNKGLLQKDKVEAIFSRYVSPQVAKEVLKDLDLEEEVELGGEHLLASVFFADIVGFTSLSEALEPQEISELLNVYFSKITEVVSFCEGHVDKFIGDCAMVVFGVPVINKQHAFDCIACGWMILQLLHELNRKREAEGKMRVEFRIGANSGMMLAGNMGSSERMEYTVVGDSVNLASRLCGSGEPGELIITEDVFEEQSLGGLIQIEDKDFIRLRGKKLPIKTLVVTDILTPFKQQMLNEIALIIQRCDKEE